jgi:hypothetical protein
LPFAVAACHQSGRKKVKMSQGTISEVQKSNGQNLTLGTRSGMPCSNSKRKLGKRQLSSDFAEKVPGPALTIYY